MMPTSPTPRAALHPRVSTHHGQDVGLQLDALREVAAARGWVVVEEFVDEGISGTKTTRPGPRGSGHLSRKGTGSGTTGLRTPGPRGSGHLSRIHRPRATLSPMIWLRVGVRHLPVGS